MTIYHDDRKKLPPADEDVRLVRDNYNRSRGELVTTTYVDKCKAAHKLYRAIVEEPEDEVDSLIKTDLVVPLAYEHIESIHPRLVANNPRIEVWGRGKEDAVRASQHRALLMYYWERLGLSLLLLDLNKQALITGTGWLKVYWRTETRNRKTVRMEQPSFFGIPIPGAPPRRVESTAPVAVYDLPQIDLLDNDEVFPDPDGYSVDSCEWVIHRSRVTLSSLEAMDWPDSGALKALKEKIKDANTEDYGVSIDEELHQEVGPEASRQPDPHKRGLHLLERWDDERVIVTVEEHPDIKPLRKEFHGIGSKPFVAYTPIPLPKKLFGMSMVEILYPFMIEISALHQARIDNVKHVAHKMMTVRMGRGIDPKQLVRRPGGWIDVMEHDDVKAFDMGDIHFSLYRETEALGTEAQRVSGATDITQGMGGPRAGGTATQAQLLAQNTASRTMVMFKVLSERLKQVGRLLVRLSDLHMTTPRMVRVAGAEHEGEEFPESGFLEVTPEGLATGSDVDLDLKIDIAEADPEVRVTRQQRAINAIQMFGSVIPPELMLAHPLVQEFFVMLAESFGMERAEEKVQAGAQMFAQMQQQAQAQEQGGQSGVETPGDQLAVDASQAAPTGDRQIPIQ